VPPSGRRADDPENPDESVTDRTRGVAASVRRSPTAVRGLFALALIYTLHVGRSFFVPIVVAILLSFLLAPLVRVFTRLRLPTTVAAALVIILLIAGIGAAGYRLAAPAATWIDEMPRALDRIESIVADVSEPVESVREATDQVERMTKVGGNDAEEPQQVEVAGTSLSDSLFQITVGFFVQLLFVFVFLFALLAYGDRIVAKVVVMAPHLGDRRQVAAIAARTERRLSGYLGTIALINLGLGLTAALAMYLLGMPNPLLWGIVGGVMNFVPFVGAMFTATVVLVAAASEFSEPLRIALPPLTFLLLTGIEAYFVTPTILAHRLTLNLIAIFLSLFFWGWLWGPIGVLLAVPMLAAVKIVSDQVERLEPLARLLEG